MATKGDKLVLEAIFNPFLTDINLDNEKDDLEELDQNGQINETEEYREAVQLELSAIKFAETGQIKEAIRLFDEAIDLAPDKASCFNNRAQALQLDGNIGSALKDLEKVLILTKDKGELAGKALCQRAIIERFLGQNEESLEDFKKASELGNAFAKSQLVKLNPYAALCNQMLSEMMSNVANGIRDQDDE